MIDEGDLCPICHDGILEVAAPDNCTCFMGLAPCSRCTDEDRLGCQKCLHAYSEICDFLENKMSEDRKLAAAAVLVAEGVTTIKCKGDLTQSLAYTYKATRELVEQLSEGDLVLVECKSDCTGFTLSRFVGADDSADVSLDGDVDYKWAVARVENPDATFQHLKSAEDQIVSRLKAARRANVRAQSLNALGIDPDTSISLIETALDGPEVRS